MAFPIFIDANIPFYAGGGPHVLKQPCVEILAMVAARRAAFMTDAEVLQEIVHRYLAVNAWSHGRTVFEEFAEIMRGRIEPLYMDDVERAAALADRYAGLSARDLIHVAVMVRLGLDTIITADGGFDRIPHLRRLDPAVFPRWRHEIETR